VHCELAHSLSLHLRSFDLVQRRHCRRRRGRVVVVGGSAGFGGARRASCSAGRDAAAVAATSVAFGQCINTVSRDATMPRTSNSSSRSSRRSCNQPSSGGAAHRPLGGVISCFVLLDEMTAVAADQRTHANVPTAKPALHITQSQFDRVLRFKL